MFQVFCFLLFFYFVSRRVKSFEGPHWGMKSTGLQRAKCLRALGKAIEDDKDVSDNGNMTGTAFGNWAYHSYLEITMMRISFDLYVITTVLACDQSIV